MSRANVPSRALTLTEELERLEQSITLTLQEIDSNFARAHRIVTGSILPIVEDYAKHSNDVWEGSRFWKQFFEASANVSLSGYEEAATEDLDDSRHTDGAVEPKDIRGGDAVSRTLPLDSSEIAADSTGVASPWQATDSPSTPQLTRVSHLEQSSESKTRSGRFAATPRMYTGSKHVRSLTAHSISATKGSAAEIDLDLDLDLDMTSQPESSPVYVDKMSGDATRQRNDAVMHRVLDKTYRVQVTPHVQRTAGRPITGADTTSVASAATQVWQDSPGSSPELAAPQLRSDLFSPYVERARVPGSSVLTPARSAPNFGTEDMGTQARRKLFTMDKRHSGRAGEFESPRRRYLVDEETEDDLIDQISPPKTIQFHIPQSRLLQTPAREASRRIVDDLLTTAGMENTDDFDDFDVSFALPGSAGSPSVVRTGFAVDNDDTF